MKIHPESMHKIPFNGRGDVSVRSTIPPKDEINLTHRCSAATVKVAAYDSHQFHTHSVTPHSLHSLYFFTQMGLISRLCFFVWFSFYICLYVIYCFSSRHTSHLLTHIRLQWTLYFYITLKKFKCREWDWLWLQTLLVLLWKMQKGKYSTCNMKM